jgi:predicted metal-dependent phosphoesterase TrpH
MLKFKFQFHVHTAKDPIDRPFHTEEQMIDFAAAKNYDIVAITCHNTWIFDEKIKSYAASKGILLIPGIEKDVEGRHVLIISADKDAEKIETFADLRQYKNKHRDCFIIAPHPYYFTWFCLRDAFEKNIDLFDAVEYSWFHTKTINSWNTKAGTIANRHNLPLIATSDNHILKYFDQQYSFVTAEEKTWPSIRKALKEGKIEAFKNPLSLWKFLLITFEMTIGFDARNRLRRLLFKK